VQCPVAVRVGAATLLVEPEDVGQRCEAAVVDVRRARPRAGSGSEGPRLAPGVDMRAAEAELGANGQHTPTRQAACHGEQQKSS
jgi:hypothetical protein